MMSIVMKLIFLFTAHAVCDYPLQGDFLARGKNRFNPIPGVPWFQCLFAHSMIHAGAVYLITGSLWLCIAELAIHFTVDYAKCAGWFSSNLLAAFNVDQTIHYACKVLWAIL